MKALLCTVLLASAGAALGQDQVREPRDVPRLEKTLKDHEFGVSTRQFGLQRRVEMYQWLRAGDGYVKGWRDAPVDSSGFDPQYANPGRFPMQTRYWVGQDITLDSKPLDEDILKVLGRWRPFRPGFTALPGNLSATFQPDGDGLSSSENPLDPQIGDLRVTWREMTLPPLVGKLTLEEGAWVLTQTETAGAGDVPAAARQTPSVSGGPRWLIWAAAVLLLLGWGLSRLCRRK